ncbi:MAG: conjugal transfer protein TraH [Holosporales bacterium]|nr:conjugal transfer protein TraH [Holosporales bacterium]
MSVSKPLETRVHSLLDSMVNKVYMDEPLTKEELAFLNSTSLPIYKILNVTTAYQRGKSPIDIRDYSRLIAYDLLSQYLLEVLDIVTINLDDLRTVQVDDSHIKRLLDGIHKVRERVVQRRSSVVQQLQSILSLIEKTSALEAQLFSTASMITQGKR